MAVIVRGSDRKLRIVLKTSKEEPLNLTLCTEIKASFIDENGDTVFRTLSDEQINIVPPEGAGIIEVILSKAFTSTLKLGERLDFQVAFTIDDEEVIHIFEALLNVKPQLGA